MSVSVIGGDCREVLRTLEAESVQCCVTSPPYFGLRDYGHDGQLGLEPTPELYVEKMVEVFREVRRVLRPDGVLFLNIGDSYAGSGKGSGGTGELSSKQNTNRGANFAAGGKLPNLALPADIKPKDLIGIPWMLAFALRADGWYLRSDIIWHKPNPMPESVTDRPTKAHEYLFLLSKSATYYYDADAIAEPASVNKPWREQTSNGGAKALATRNDGGNVGTLGKSADGTRNKRTVWTITTQPFKGAHFATMPPKLVEPCILAGTSPQSCEKCGAPWERISGREVQPEAYEDRKYDRTDPKFATKRNMGARYQAQLNANPIITTGWQPTCSCESAGTGKCVVLDPFAGAGTVGLVADRLGRSFLGVELNPEYAKIARDRIHGDAPLFAAPPVERAP